MHGDMHTIHSCAYQICTVHIRYIHACIPLYLHVSVCIKLFPEMYLVHIWLYLKHMDEKYRQIHADMHFQRSAYLHVSVCICLYVMPENLMICTRYIQICTSTGSAYLHVSDCICLYFFPEYVRICTEYIQIHASASCDLLRRFGRPQARGRCTFAARSQRQRRRRRRRKHRHVYLDHSDSWRQLEQPRCCEMKSLGALASGLPRGERVTLTMGKLIIPIDWIDAHCWGSDLGFLEPPTHRSPSTENQCKRQ